MSLADSVRRLEEIANKQNGALISLIENALSDVEGISVSGGHEPGANTHIFDSETNKLMTEIDIAELKFAPYEKHITPENQEAYELITNKLLSLGYTKVEDV